MTLLEYNNIEGMILLSELSRRRIRSINKLIRVNRTRTRVSVVRAERRRDRFGTFWWRVVSHRTALFFYAHPSWGALERVFQAHYLEIQRNSNGCRNRDAGNEVVMAPSRRGEYNSGGNSLSDWDYCVVTRVGGDSTMSPTHSRVVARDVGDTLSDVRLWPRPWGSRVGAIPSSTRV